MTEFESLTVYLEAEKAFDKTWAQLSESVRQRIERDLPLFAGTIPQAPMLTDHAPADLQKHREKLFVEGPGRRLPLVGGNRWDGLSVGQRREAAHQRDDKINPAFEVVRRAHWASMEKKDDLEREIAETEAKSAPTHAEEREKQALLTDLHQKLACVDAELLAYETPDQSIRPPRRAPNKIIGDDDAVQRMRKAIDNGEASSVNNAAVIEARKLTEKSDGTGVKSTTRRLKRKYEKAYPRTV